MRPLRLAMLSAILSLGLVGCVGYGAGHYGAGYGGYGYGAYGFAAGNHSGGYYGGRDHYRGRAGSFGGWSGHGFGH